MPVHPHEDNHEMFSLISALSRAIRCCQQEAVFCENVTFSQFSILDFVAKKGKLKLADLHRILSVDKSTTTRLVHPLVKQGLIFREKSNSDSRAIILSLTHRGVEVHRKVWECLSGFIADIQKEIPEKRKIDVYEALKIFLKALQHVFNKDQ